MSETRSLPESPNNGTQGTIPYSGGELVWPIDGYGPRPDRRHRLLEEIVTPQQLMAVLQNERVQALVSLSFERESRTLTLEEFEELKELLREAGVPPISFRSTINTVFEDIKLRRNLPDKAID